MLLELVKQMHFAFTEFWYLIWELSYEQIYNLKFVSVVTFGARRNKNSSPKRHCKPQTSLQWRFGFECLKTHIIPNVTILTSHIGAFPDWWEKILWSTLIGQYTSWGPWAVLIGQMGQGKIERQASRFKAENKKRHCTNA